MTAGIPRPRTVSERARNGALMGLIFLIAASIVFALPFPGADSVRMILVGGSPIYIWRFLSCQSDPLWIMKFQGIFPFFVCGVALGYFLHLPKELNRRYV